jgi:hypothetical protein
MLGGFSVRTHKFSYENLSAYFYVKLCEMLLRITLVVVQLNRKFMPIYKLKNQVNFFHVLTKYFFGLSVYITQPASNLMGAEGSSHGDKAAGA